jgi:MFS family permease
MSEASLDMNAPSTPPHSSPLRHEAFRAVWIAAVFSYVGTWVQDVGEGWLMTSLTRDPLPVAMLTTAMTVPMFALLLPAGVMADRFDRRRLLIVSQGMMATVAAALALVTWLGWTSPAVLLFASAGLGVGSALSSPAWNTLVPELVPRRETAEAVLLNSVAFNIARTVGPAVGGLLATRQPAIAFLLNAVSFLGVIEVLRRYDEVKHAARAVKRRPESIGRALMAAFEQLRRSPKLRAMHIAVATFGFAAASPMALMPFFAKERLGTNGGGYGLMLGAIGSGGILAALFLKRVRGVVSARGLVAGAMATYGIAILAMSTTRSLPFAIALLLPAGMAWVSTFSTLNALVQLSSPLHLKSRALALYQLSFYAAWSVGAFAGGAIANRIGVSLAVGLAATGTLAAAALSARLSLPSYEGDPPSSHDALATPAPVSVR